MSREFPELDQARLVVDETVKERHLAVIHDEIRAGGAPRFKRFRLLAVATAMLLVLPVVALAAENAVPGDALYPVKRLFEPVVGLFNSDVEVDNRVEEVEILYERDVGIDLIWERIERARDVVTDAHPDHAERLREVVDELEASGISDDTPGEPDSNETREDTHQGSTDEPSDSTIEREEETRDPEVTTTTLGSDRTTPPGERSRDG